jgi:hypothetical protein
MRIKSTDFFKSDAKGVHPPWPRRSQQCTLKQGPTARFVKRRDALHLRGNIVEEAT